MKDTQALIIIGTGGSAQDVLDVVDAINAQTPTWHVLGFLDDARTAGTLFMGFEILGSIEDAATLSAHAGGGRLDGAAFINTIGSERTYQARRALIDRSGLSDNRFATLSHPQAGVSPRAQLGAGICINYGVSVAGNVLVGQHVWLGPGSIVGHDSIIGDYSLLAPDAVVSGNVKIGESCYIGAGAQIRQRVTIGSGALIGMAAVVLHNVPPGAVVVGNPARILREVPSPGAPA